MFMQGIILTSVGLVTTGLICLVIFSVGYEIGKSVQVSTAQAELANILERVCDSRRGLKTLQQELNTVDTVDK